MTANAPKSTAITPYAQKVHTVRQLFERAQPQIAAALPTHLNPARMIRICMTSIQKTPALLDCTPTSLLACVVGAAQLGLEPDGVLGHAYLVPFKDKGTPIAQLIVGYRGMIDLARRSGQIISIHARVVHKGDAFSYDFGLDEKLTHTPAEGPRGDLTHVYAIARLKGGGLQFEVMTRNDVDMIRARSRAAQSGPWVTDYEEMAKKTVIRRLFKLLPVSVEIAKAEHLNRQADDGEQQDVGDVVDVTEEPSEMLPEKARTTADLAAAAAAKDVTQQRIDAINTARDIDGVTALMEAYRTLKVPELGGLEVAAKNRVEQLAKTPPHDATTGEVREPGMEG